MNSYEATAEPWVWEPPDEPYPTRDDDQENDDE